MSRTLLFRCVIYVHSFWLSVSSPLSGLVRLQPFLGALFEALAEG
jgi:hypothetical protein